ncbi:MAG: hypothetical protein KTR35_21100 [Gammaproteobacteria bacterium]|nr:hypothetical protein [Gammaproteobacteria bacterium]
MKLHSLCMATLVSVASMGVDAAGFQQIRVDDPGQGNLTVGLWYPTSEAPPSEPNTEYGLPVALNADIEDANGGLILISHGFGGWYAGHADTAIALADAGFIVAAPTHTGNTWSDMSSSVDQWVLDRPRHISRVIDSVLADEVLASHIDSANIGVYGFSAGGLTAMSLIGAVPDMSRAKEFCAQREVEFACDQGLVDQMLKARMSELPKSAWGADSRIAAAVISAPGLGFAYTRESLADVVADVQLWSGELDDSVPTEFNAAYIADLLPNPSETHWIEKANHFAFMTVSCREEFKQNDPEEYSIVCGDAEGFDRYQFHNEMHQEMVRFYAENFATE